MFFKIDALENFAIFNKVVGLAQVFYCKICDIFKNTLFTEYLCGCFWMCCISCSHNKFFFFHVKLFITNCSRTIAPKENCHPTVILTLTLTLTLTQTQTPTGGAIFLGAIVLTPSQHTQFYLHLNILFQNHDFEKELLCFE